MALKKKYQTIEELLVYPSLEPTIEVIPDDGAHRYRARCGNNKGAHCQKGKKRAVHNKGS